MNKKLIHVHVGMGKTGTTALQHFFWENREALAAYGIEYPEYGVVSAAHHLLSPHRPPFLSDWEFIDIEEWAPVLDKKNYEKILISSELTFSASPQIIKLFCQNLLKWFDVKIIIYFRRQDNLLMAAYNQQVKAGTQKVDFLTMLSGQFHRFNFLDKLEPWVNGVGKENIIIIPFERQQFYKDDIRKDFLSRVFDISDFDAFLFDKDNKNPRFSPIATEYKRLINNVIPNTKESSMFNEVLAKYSVIDDIKSNDIYSKTFIAPSNIRLQILRRSDLVNKTIAKEFLGREDGMLFYDEWPRDDEQPEIAQITDDDLKNISLFIVKEDNDLIGILKDKINKVFLEDYFEAYRQAKRLEKTY